MKAYLLAGGRGERLRPLTDRIPKCLAPIDAQPLLGFWLDLFRREGVTDVLLNVSHHVDQVHRFLASGASAGVRVTVVEEPAPVGSARTVLRERAFVDGEESFWIVYADNLSDIRLGAMRALHAQHREAATIGLFHTPTPTAAGIVGLEPDGRIRSFVEKPAQPDSDLANAGVYLARPALLEAIPDRPGIIDFGLDVLPTLAGHMYGCVLGEFHQDIGTPERLAAAAAAWPHRARPGTPSRPVVTPQPTGA
jgi:mannose-1-phosphate guanylyltransferase